MVDGPGCDPPVSVLFLGWNMDRVQANVLIAATQRMRLYFGPRATLSELVCLFVYRR